MFSEIKSYWTDGTISQIFGMLTKRDKRKISSIIFMQFLLSLFDLIGVALIGVLGSLTVAGIQSQNPSNLIAKIISILQVNNLTFQMQCAVIGGMAALVLVTRTLLSVSLARVTLRFLSFRTAEITSDTVARFLSSSLIKVQEKSAQENLYSLTLGVSSLFMGVVATSINMISDLAVLIVLTSGLAVVNPVMSASTLLFFGGVGLLMFSRLHRKAESLGRRFTELSVKQNQMLLEVFNSYREFLIRGRHDYYNSQFSKVKHSLAATDAEVTFLPSITKYVMEMAIVLGAVVLSASQFIAEDASHAIAMLTIFLAAGSRMAPALLRLQQSALQIRNSLGSSHRTLELLGSLPDLDKNVGTSSAVLGSHPGFMAQVVANNLTFSYPGVSEPAVKEVSLRVEPSSSIAIVGSSGAGKSTLVDLLLGILQPSEGDVQVSNINPKSAILKWPGAVAYVPQDILIIDGTIRENVALGYSVEEATEERVMKALITAQLDELIKELPSGIDTHVGDRGSQLSGGQRQRLGIARALFTSPKLLVLDEATSALDGETEARIADSLSKIKGETTLILIAHRLSTVRNADKVVYLEQGRIRATGSFDEVRKAVPEFDHQANLMGL